MNTNACVDRPWHEPPGGDTVAQIALDSPELADLFEAERARLTRFCAYLTGAPGAAEDLAQETLFEAWRNRHKLHDPSGAAHWLTAIARNVCLRWGRKHGRQLALAAANAEAGATDAEGVDAVDALAEAPDPFDFEVELERGELATLLDRAMDLLPADTRAALLAHYVAESPLAEVAQRCGLSEGTLAVRLHRGKLALRHILNTRFRDEAQAFGLVSSEVAWQQTHLWCLQCGNQRLIGYLDAGRGILLLRCPVCGRFNHSEGLREEIGGAKGFKTAYSRLSMWSERYYRPGLERGTAACSCCGKPVRPRLRTWDREPMIDASCPSCGGENTLGLSGVVLSHAPARAFLRRYPRARVLPTQPIERDGRPALLTGIVSMTGAAHLDLVLDARVLRLMSLSGSNLAQLTDS